MRSSPPALAALLLVVLAPASALSNTILVPSIHPTIQAGLNAAAPGDTVLVGPGTYTGASNRNLDFVGKAVVLRSSAGAATTIIDCQGAARGFRFHTNETALTVVQGFTIRNATDGGAAGGGMSIENASPTIQSCIFAANQGINGAGAAVTGGSPLFTACQFVGNPAIGQGGAFFADGVSSPSFLNCNIGQNTAPFGGGMYLGGAGCSVTLTGCTFAGNSAVSSGGGIYAHGSALTMERCTWSQNTAKRGAGLYCTDGASATFDSCSFTLNTAGESGGGAYCNDPFSVSLTHTDFTGNRGMDVAIQNRGGGLFCERADNFLMADCTFTNNQVFDTVNEGRGGGLYYRNGAAANVVRCTFTGNVANYGGGAHTTSLSFEDCEFTDNSALGGGGGVDAGLSSTIVQCTFTRNHAAWGGGAILQGESPVTVEDCTFEDNTASQTGGGLFREGPAEISNSLFRGNTAGTGGGLYSGNSFNQSQSQISNCTIYDNSAWQGSALTLGGPFPPDPPLGVTTITQCTIAHNRTGPSLDVRCPVTLSRSIIAFGVNGEALACLGNGLAALSCINSFGNAGGNWTNCIADQLGINGNFAADPRFCDMAGGDFTLAQSSPCAPANSPSGCGLIGAHPVGCVSPIGIADAGAPPVTPSLRILPNPLRTAGMIEWNTPVEAFTLYDASGRLVVRHELRATSAAKGQVAWQDFLSGKRLAPGVYFLRSLAPAGVKLADETVVVLP